jgi:serine/threonine protein kinase
VEALLCFRREAEAASRLQHPGICTVYDAGIEGQTAFIAMAYVEGLSLAQSIATARDSGSSKSALVVLVGPTIVEKHTSSAQATGAPTTPTARAEILRVVGVIEKAARALHAAHEAGIIHRDIKPANLMVTPEGEPVVMDFGLAHLEDSDLPTLTRTGDLFGTPAYMSTEQLASHRIRLDRRTGVWSLGVTLYECLSLRRPFDAPTREGMYKQILTKDPPDIRHLNPAVPADLGARNRRWPYLPRARRELCTQRLRVARHARKRLRVVCRPLRNLPGIYTAIRRRPALPAGHPIPRDPWLELWSSRRERAVCGKELARPGDPSRRSRSSPAPPADAVAHRAHVQTFLDSSESSRKRPP